MEHLVRSIDQIGNAVRRRRKLAKLSQGELCDRTSLRQATISNLEGGDRNPHHEHQRRDQLDTLLAVLTALNLELVVRDRTTGPKIEDIF